MAPSCALDEAGLRSQLERYRQVGKDARLIERTPRSLVVDLYENVDVELAWGPERRRLTQAAHEPAIDAIAFALNLQASD